MNKVSEAKFKTLTKAISYNYYFKINRTDSLKVIYKFLHKYVSND